MYKCEYFVPSELVDRETFRRFGYTSYRFFDDRVLKVADWLRSKLGPATINDWSWREDEPPEAVFEWSGLRTPRWDEAQPREDGKKRYNPYSDHSLGCAVDMKFKFYSADYVRSFIKDNWEQMQKDLGIDSITLEEGVGWVHVATRNNKKGINLFKP